MQLLKYTEDDYVKLLTHDDWTKCDTDTLMTLVQRFGMNFILVHDRCVHVLACVSWCIVRP